MANFDGIKDKALETLGTILDKSSELYNTAEAKAKKLAKVAKLKSDIARNYSEVRKLYADLGSLYYTLHGAEPEDATSQLCQEIKIILDKVEACQSELDALNAQEDAPAEDDFEVEEIVAEEVEEPQPEEKTEE